MESPFAPLERVVLEEIASAPGITSHELAERVGKEVMVIETACRTLVSRDCIQSQPAGYFVGYRSTDRGAAIIDTDMR